MSKNLSKQTYIEGKLMVIHQYSFWFLNYFADPKLVDGEDYAITNKSKFEQFNWSMEGLTPKIRINLNKWNKIRKYFLHLKILTDVINDFLKKINFILTTVRLLLSMFVYILHAEPGKRLKKLNSFFFCNFFKNGKSLLIIIINFF